MIYPDFLKQNDKVGICAPSAGIGEEDFENFDFSLSYFKKEGYKISETASVRTGLSESAEPHIRGAEFNELIHDEKVKAVICAAGGDFLISMLPYVDYKSFKKSPKWVQGYSDPTGLLYSITTSCDVATIYGANAGGFGMRKLHKSLKDNLDILKGDIKVQHSFDRYESVRGDHMEGFNLDSDVKWITPCGDVDIEGRLLGGCLDCIAFLLGTRFDRTLDFINRYGKDGIIWYFDIFSMKAEDVYCTLFKMKDMGLFSNAKGFVFGRVAFPASFCGLSYMEVALKVLGDVPMIFEADVGHVSPKMTIINGAFGKVRSSMGKGSLEMMLK